MGCGFWIEGRRGGLSSIPIRNPKSGIQDPKDMADKKKNSGKSARPSPGAPGAPTGSGPMDVGLLEQIVRLMADNDLNTVDLRDGDRRVILKRGQPVVSLPGVPAFQGMPAMPTSFPASAPPPA